MKNIIFCFTGTGNSLKVSQDIAGVLEDCEIYNTKAYNTRCQIKDCNRIGFVFPVYYLGMPQQMNEFIEKLQIPKDFKGYFYAVATYANYTGNTLNQVNTALKKRGFFLHYGANIKMADNMIAYYSKINNMEKLAENYRSKMPDILKSVQRKDIKIFSQGFLPLSLYHNIQISQVSQFSSKLQISEDCTGCGICKDICPADNIFNNKDNRFFYKNNCQQCMACIQFCSSKAIDYKGKCRNRTRYRHPEISLKEIREINI